MRWLVLAFLAARVLGAQQIGGVTLRLGELQRAALARLATYTLTSGADATGFWFVTDTTKWHGQPDYGNLGTIQFRNGELVSVNRRWESSAADGVGAVGLVSAALRQLEGEKNCVIESVRLPSPEMQADLVRVHCGNHEITVGLSDQAGQRFYHIGEAWLKSHDPR